MESKQVTLNSVFPRDSSELADSIPLIISHLYSVIICIHLEIWILRELESLDNFFKLLLDFEPRK